MYKIFLIIKIFLLFLVISGCQTFEEKSEEIIKKENKKLSKFIGQPVSELKIVMGQPSKEGKNDSGQRLFIYNTKKYGLSCVRKFEVNEVDMIVGFSSKGCF